jgi:hypothetical protein
MVQLMPERLISSKAEDNPTALTARKIVPEICCHISAHAREPLSLKRGTESS